MERTVGSLFLKIFSILFFAAFAGTTLFFAYGYRFDVEERILEKTSIIDVINEVSDVSLFLNGREVVQNIPYQIKGVLPGLHDLKLQKKGFLTWERTVKVEEDIVTIVVDALPVPADLDLFYKEVLKLNTDDEIFFGDDFILSYASGDNDVRLINLFDNGKILEEIISLYQEDFEIVDVYAKEKFLITFGDPYSEYKAVLYAYVSFAEKEFDLFALPEEAERIRVDGRNNYVFFLREGDLYGISFDRLKENEFDSNEYMPIKSGVEKFDIDDRGNLFYISTGMLYKSWYNGENVKLLDQHPLRYKNLAINFVGNNKSLVVRANDDTRKLFYLSDSGDVRLLSENLYGNADINGRNEMIYSDTEGHIFLFDVVDQEKTYIEQIESEFELMGWFGDDGYFVIKKGTTVYLHDRFHVEPVVLFDQLESDFSVLVGRAFYTYKDGILSRLYFDEAYLNE